MANLFQVQAVQQLTHIEVVLNGNTSPGAIIYPRVYSIDTLGNFNVIIDGSGTNCEHIITTNDIAYNTGPNPNSICLCLPNGGLTCQPNVSYLASVGHYGGANDMVIAQGGTSPFWSSFILDATNTWYYMNSLPMIRMLFDNCACNSVTEIDNEPIHHLLLGQNIPNPSNNITTINTSCKK